MIVDRYLLGRVAQPFAAILGVLLAVFTGYSVAAFLSDAVNGALPTGVIAELTVLKALISLEVLIPASLYVSVLVAFARLHADAEFTAMAALGMRRTTIIRAVLTLSAVLAVMVASLSLFARPWAYGRLHAISSAAASLLDVDAMQPGVFYVTDKGRRVVRFEDRDQTGAAQAVFARLRGQDLTRIIFARHAQSVQGSPNVQPSGGVQGKASNVYLQGVTIYDFQDKSSHPAGILEADALTVDANGGVGAPPAYSAVSASTGHIARSTAAEDVAEFQWRLFTPLSTLLLGMLAIPLSRVRQRQRRRSQLSLAILIYFGYYLLSTAARTWVQHGSIPRFPGIWWVSVLLTLLVLTLMSAAEPVRLFQRRRA